MASSEVSPIGDCPDLLAELSRNGGTRGHVLPGDPWTFRLTGVSGSLTPMLTWLRDLRVTLETGENEMVKQ